MLRLAVRVRRSDAELVLAELLELAPGGVEEVDIDPETVEYAVYGAPGELPELPDLRAAAGTALVDVTTTEVADDWADRWREFHRPLVLGDRLSRAGRRGSRRQATALDLVIDPGPRVRHRRARDDEALPGAAARASPCPAAPLAGRGTLRSISGAAPACSRSPRPSSAGRAVLALDYDQLCVDATIENAAGQRRRRAHRRPAVRPACSDPVPPARLVLAQPPGAAAARLGASRC